MSGFRTKQRSNPKSGSSMTEQDAILAIQDWFNGTNARSKMEDERVISNNKDENGPSIFKAASNFRRSDTVKMSKIIPNIGSFTLLVNMGSRQQEFENGPSTFKAASNFRRSDTVKMSKIIPNIGSSELSFLLKTT